MSGTVEARVAKRARIVLLAAEGLSNREIGELVDLHYNQVGVWRKRYASTVWPDWTTRSGRAGRACMTMTTCCCWSRP